MGKTIRDIATAALVMGAPMAVLAQLDDLKLNGVDLAATEGTQELHRVRAESALVEEGATRLQATNIQLTSRISGDREVVANAEHGIIPISGDMRPHQEEGAEKPTLRTLEDVLSYMRDFREKSIYGDVFLEGGEEPVHATMGDGGELLATSLIWSRLYDLVVIPSDFTQKGKGQGDADVTASAAACFVDKGFTEWTYFATEGKSIRIVYTMPLTTEKEGSTE